MRIRNLRNVPVLLRYAGFRKISISRKGLSETVPVVLARSHNVIRDVSRRVIELVYEDGEMDPRQTVRELRAAAAKDSDRALVKAPNIPEPKLDLIAERMLERLRMLKPETVEQELSRLRRMADMNPNMAITIGRVVDAYNREKSARPAVVPVLAPVSDAQLSLELEQDMLQPDLPAMPPAVSEPPLPTKADVRMMRKADLLSLAIKLGVEKAGMLTMGGLRSEVSSRIP